MVLDPRDFDHRGAGQRNNKVAANLAAEIATKAAAPTTGIIPVYRAGPPQLVGSGGTVSLLVSMSNLILPASDGEFTLAVGDELGLVKLFLVNDLISGKLTLKPVPLITGNADVFTEVDFVDKDDFLAIIWTGEFWKEFYQHGNTNGRPDVKYL